MKRNNSSTYARYYNKVKDLITVEDAVQTEDFQTKDYTFLQNMIDDFVKDCLKSK